MNTRKYPNDFSRGDYQQCYCRRILGFISLFNKPLNI